MNIRSKTIAITPSLDKWLRWAAMTEDTSAEAIINDAVSTALLAKYPKLKEIEDNHAVASAKLWNEAADKLKEGK